MTGLLMRRRSRECVRESASLSCAARVGGVRPRGADALCVAFGRGHPQNVCVVCYRRPGVSRGFVAGWRAVFVAEIKLS